MFFLKKKFHFELKIHEVRSNFTASGSLGFL